MRFRILSLDGGGAKGAYTLGALKEIELRLGGAPLYEKFDMLFGTSTGSIIGSLIGLGWSINKIYEKYLELIPLCFEHNNASDISECLEKEVNIIFKNMGFDKFLTRVGIIATNIDQDRAMIFKSHLDQVYSGEKSYKPGFGATISDAVLGSSAAVPYILSRYVETETDGFVHVVDGGFVANNPSLFAITDAVGALGVKQDDISLISLGTGHFIEKEPKAPFLRRIGRRLVDNYMPIDIFSKSMSANSEAADRVIRYAFPHIKRFRLSEYYPGSNFETHLLDNKPENLEKMFAFGRNSFCEREKEFDKAYVD